MKQRVKSLILVMSLLAMLGKVCYGGDWDKSYEHFTIVTKAQDSFGGSGL